MVKLIALVQTALLVNVIFSATYNVPVGSYLSVTYGSTYACKQVQTYSLIFQSSYFSTTSQPISYYLGYDFTALDTFGGPTQTTSSTGIVNVWSTTTSANSYTGLENGNFFRFGASSTSFTLTYAPGIFYEPFVTTYNNTLDNQSMKDRVKLNFPVTINKTPITGISATTANPAAGTQSCMTLSMSNPCVTIISTTKISITLSNYGVVIPLAAFDVAACNVSVNGSSPSGRACSVSGNTLEVTGLFSAHLSASSVSIQVCNITKTAAGAPASNLKLINPLYAGTPGIYAEGNFSF